MMLACEEPRLPKKPITPFSTIIETTSSITILFECVQHIIRIPITNTVLLTYVTQRMQNFLEHQDPNLRFISQCLDSNDEPTRLLVLDLLMALANSKTIDGIASKIFSHFKGTATMSFKDLIVRRVLETCSQNNYAIVSDFDWYISVIGDFVEEGGFICFELVAD
jgi:hypothetical protein